jgi:formylglycine-generating enzyme required for sulfatase activity
VSSFRLDDYEVTVGRFRTFVAAARGGYRPASAAGKHDHLSSGLGLLTTDGGYEPGWDAAWNDKLSADWDVTLDCNPAYATWTPAADKERLPINCVNWYEAYAFCIWDGGFLPSETEWEYVAAGGGEERLYPWGTEPPSATRAVYGCMRNADGGSCTGFANIAPVGAELDGRGRWGQSDLAGNLWEWVLDIYNIPTPPGACANCTDLVGRGGARGTRGGAFYSPPEAMATPNRGSDPPDLRDWNVGVRCARTP